MRNRVVLGVLFLLLIAEALPSCKSPISPTPAGPTLTLILPDSAHVFDTLAISAHFSESIEPTWLFAWQFGDSAKASTRWLPVSHIYDSAGTFTVQLAVTDTFALKTIAKQTGQLKVMPLNTPTLMLTAPATNFWGDSCPMRIQSSLPLKPSWAYSWTFGDSTTLTSGQDSILHYFVTPGTFTVRVSLSDTQHHIPLGSQTATVKVTARHFNLALLQSMKYVDFRYQARISLSSTGGGGGPCGTIPTTDTLTWSGVKFTMNSTISYEISEPQVEKDSEYGVYSINGTMNNDSSELDIFSGNIFYTSQDFNYMENSGCYTTYDNFFDAEAVPLLRQSDTDVVFKARGNLIKNARYGNIFSGAVPHTGQFSVDDTAVFSDQSADPYVTIRFHK